MNRSTTIQLQFLKRLDIYEHEKPYWLFVAKPDSVPDAKLTNVEMESVSGIPVQDVRHSDEDYRIDTHGFQFVTHDQTFHDFDDENLVQEKYVPQVEKLIESCIPNAEKVFVFDWRIRQEKPTEDLENLVSPAQIQNRNYVLAPSQSVHTDCTEFTLHKRVRFHFPENASNLLQGRIQMINFWRPVYHEVKNWPLLVCDGRTTPLENLVAVDQIGRQFVGDIYYAVYDPAYKWYYQSSMGVNEGVLFKSWDTAKSVPSKVCIHSSCSLPIETLPDVYHPRRSIEARALVFLPPEDLSTK